MISSPTNNQSELESLSYNQHIQHAYVIAYLIVDHVSQLFKCYGRTTILEIVVI